MRVTYAALVLPFAVAVLILTLFFFFVGGDAAFELLTTALIAGAQLEPPGSRCRAPSPGAPSLTVPALPAVLHREFVGLVLVAVIVPQAPGANHHHAPRSGLDAFASDSRVYSRTIAELLCRLTRIVSTSVRPRWPSVVTRPDRRLWAL